MADTDVEFREFECALQRAASAAQRGLRRRCKLYDFERSVWLGYDGAVAAA